MEEVKEIYNESKESLKQIIEVGTERLKNPLLGAFFISFILYNWKTFLYLLFSTSSIEIKIFGIRNNYFEPNGILIPIFIAIVYYVALPFLLAGFEYILSYAYKWRLGIDYGNKISETRKKGVLAFSEKRTQEIASGNRDRNDLLKQIRNLEKTIEQLNETSRTKEELHNKQLNDLNNLLNNLNQSRNFSTGMKFDSENSSWNSFAKEFNHNEAKSLISLPFNKTKITFDKLPKDKINALLNLKLLEEVSDGVYSFTKSGNDFRNFLINTFN